MKIWYNKWVNSSESVNVECKRSKNIWIWKRDSLRVWVKNESYENISPEQNMGILKRILWMIVIWVLASKTSCLTVESSSLSLSNTIYILNHNHADHHLYLFINSIFTHTTTTIITIIYNKDPKFLLVFVKKTFMQIYFLRINVYSKSSWNVLMLERTISFEGLRCQWEMNQPQIKIIKKEKKKLSKMYYIS